ncbi:MAG: hypothetical protein LBS03_08310 [Bacteroidales bacterium]|nr:hypothetical protein [Bacteroidales bacterium]
MIITPCLPFSPCCKEKRALASEYGMSAHHAGWAESSCIIASEGWRTSFVVTFPSTIASGSAEVRIAADVCSASVIPTFHNRKV